MSVLVLVAGSLPLQADVIYLKNGKKIVAAVLHQDERKVTYEQSGNQVTIPLNLIDHIEKAPLPAEHPESGADAPEKKLDLPAPQLSELADAPDAIIKENRVDTAALQRLDDAVLRNPTEENRFRLGLAYRRAANFLVKSGNTEGAIELCRHALNFAPHDLNLTLVFGHLLILEAHYREAIEMLRPAEVQFPRSPDVPLLLGSAYYYTEQLDRALAEWKHSLSLRNDPQVSAAITKAEQERNAAASYRELHSPHFLLRYQGGAELRPLAEQVLATLEAAFRDLEADLDVYPQEQIVVLLYPDQVYRDITRVPAWAGAVNDGKIRVPVSGLTSMTPDLARTLKHELTHSFVRQVTAGHCPFWFNEGLAQLEEGSTTAGEGTHLARSLLSGSSIPFESLENPFIELPPSQVMLAYVKSLAALEYLRDTYGMSEVRRLLREFPENPDTGAILEKDLRLDYAGFEQAVATYVEKRYGS